MPDRGSLCRAASGRVGDTVPQGVPEDRGIMIDREFIINAVHAKNHILFPKREES
jgi:hypothetical protein